MSKPSQSDSHLSPAIFEKIPLDQLRQGRRGKHHKFVDIIIAELANLPDAEAMKIPLDTLKGVSLANLRSAVSRAAKTRGVKLATFSEGKNLYIWKRSANTGKFERKRSNGRR